MNIDQLKEVWKKVELHAASESDQDLKLKLQAVISTQGKIRKYFWFEMITAITAIILFGAVVYVSGDLEPYFYKLFALVILGSLPLNIRLFLSMKRILGIKYTTQLKDNIISARNHLKTTIRIYYTLVVIIMVALVLMSWWDDYFLQLSIAWQLGVMSYFLLYLIISIYLIKKFYGGKLVELDELLKDT
jgi:hypothetical protein